MADMPTADRAMADRAMADRVGAATRRPTSQRPTSQRPRLSTQIAIVTTLVATITALLSFVVSAGLIRTAAQRQARDTLDHYATLLADGLANRTSGTPAQRLRAALPGIRALDRVARITPIWVHPDNRIDQVAADAAPGTPARLGAALLAADRERAAAGTAFDESVTLARHSYFVTARPLADGDGSIVLIQPETTTSQLTSPLRTRIIIALLAGLGVAAVTGMVMARRIARPLTRAAGAAWRMTHGHRDVRLDPAGPREVAEVSDSLNTLASALDDEEKRQRNFFASVSHELRTPLTAVVGYAEALADGVVPAEQTAEVGSTMLAESRRLARLAGDLLDLARAGMADFAVEVSDVDLTELVRSAAQVWSVRCAKEGVTLQVDVPEGALLVRSDAGRLRQILDGLAENALRATPPGSQIVLVARPARGTNAQLEVRDGGPGLTDDDLRIAFDPFALHERYRTERKVGAGLGLALIAQLAARLGGTVSAGHAPEHGACFTVTLPLQPAAPPASRHVPSQSV